MKGWLYLLWATSAGGGLFRVRNRSVDNVKKIVETVNSIIREFNRRNTRARTTEWDVLQIVKRIKFYYTEK